MPGWLSVLMVAGRPYVLHVAGEVGDGDVRLQLEAEMQERLLLRRAQNQVVMVVADREVDRSVVALGRLGHAEGREIVVLRPFDVRGLQRHVPELEHLRVEFSLHSDFLLKTSAKPTDCFLAIQRRARRSELRGVSGRRTCTLPPVSPPERITTTFLKEVPTA